MRKYFLSFVALAAMLFATSCQESLVEPQIAGPTTFTVQLPDQMGTKAFGDAGIVTELLVEVYPQNGESVIYQTVEQGTGQFEVSLNLIQDQAYDILFWAQTANGYVVVSGNETNGYSFGSLRNVPMNSNYLNNDNGAAFFHAEKGFVPNGTSTTITLVRPFAQLNLGTTTASLTTDAGVYELVSSAIKVTGMANSFNVFSGEGFGDAVATYNFNSQDVPDESLSAANATYEYVSMNYLSVLGNEKALVNIDATIVVKKGTEEKTINHSFTSVPVQENYRTNIVGNLISSTTDFVVTIEEGFVKDDKYGVLDGKVYERVYNSEEFNDAFENDNIDMIILESNIDLNQTLTRATTSDYTLTISAEKELIIDLNGKELSATSSQTGKDYNMFDVRGTLTVKNGTMEYEHLGDNMESTNSTNLFNVTAGGILNLEGVTAKNLGGSDMGFVVHLNNWGEVTLNAENCTLESNYIPVRVFNSGPDMNNVTIKNSTLKGGSASFWVQMYTKEDFGSQEKADSQKELLNLNIYNQGNTFDPDVNGILYGFTNYIRTDAYGITKVVSEDGTEVTLGSLIENGLVRRGVAGDEGNTTIKKVVVEEGITTLYDRTFRRFYALEEVVLPEGLTTIGETGSGVFQSCTALKDIVIPESVTVLGKGTFQECSSLESINIPSGVTRIEENCLRATGLVSVEFHAGVTYFGAQAFRDCKQLTEVIINAPEFTMEGNTFGIMAAPFTPMTIYVANSEMKAYVESKLTDHAKTYITVVAPTIPDSSSALSEALSNGERVVLAEDMTFSANETPNTGYGAAGVIVSNGAVLDGQGHTLTVNNAWTTWDCAIAATGGTIKNLTVSSAMRGIFMHGADGDVYIDNVIFDNVIYTFNSDAGSKNYGVYISNSTLNGWTSHSDVHKEVVYTNCKFGKGNGYAYCRPYGPTSFVGCDFCEGYTVEPLAAVTFENCTINGVALTAENISTLVTSTEKVTVK